MSPITFIVIVVAITAAIALVGLTLKFLVVATDGGLKSNVGGVALRGSVDGEVGFIHFFLRSMTCTQYDNELGDLDSGSSCRTFFFHT